MVVIMSTATSLDPYVRVYGPDGSLLYTAYNANGPGVTGFQTAPLPTTGTYNIMVGDYGDGTETGSYGIFVQRTNNPRRVTPIAFGETVSASLDAVGQCDTYTFDANAGDKILVRMSTTSVLDPSISIYDPDGTWLGWWWNTGPGTVEFTTDPLPKAGAYTLLVRDDQFNETGPYGIFVQRLNDPGKATSIGFGETISASLSAAGEVDTYTFDAVAGDRVLVRMGTEGTLDPRARLYGPDGSLLGETPFVSGAGHYLGLGASELVAVVAISGTCTVIATDNVSSGGDPAIDTGNYWIFVQRLNAPGMATQISYGQTVSGSINPPYEGDTYTFDAVAGDRVLVRMGTEGTLDPRARLYGPDGSLLGETPFVSGPGHYLGRGLSELEAVVATSGICTVIATDNVSSGGDPAIDTGNYWISLALESGVPGSLAVTPSDSLNSSGLLGGPFSPLSMTYTLENKGSGPIDWTLTKTADWVMISSAGDTLNAGATQTVTVSLDQQKVAALPVGTYLDTLTFTNLTEANRRMIRSVRLRVDPIEGILRVSPDGGFSSKGPLRGPFDPAHITYSLANIGEKAMTWRAAKTAYWLSLSSDHGALDPGASADVTLSFNNMAKDLAEGAYTDTVTFTNTANGYGNASRDVSLLVGVSYSTISAELSRSSLLLGDLGNPLVVSGQITPPPCDAGAWVDVVLVSSAGMESHRSVIANALGQFSYPISCADISREGSWTVRTSWNGDRCLAGSSSQQEVLQVTKAGSRVTVDAGSQAVKLGDPVDLSGKFTPDPDCGRDLRGIEVKLLIYGPEGRFDMRTVTTNDQFGHFQLQAYKGFTALGQWVVQALFVGDQAYKESTSEVITVRVVETAGYAVIVQGRIENQEGLASHQKTAAFVYAQLRERGLLDEDITYLSYDTTQPGVDGVPTKAAVQQAITQWARDKMNAKPANLYIILVDHGLSGRFFLYPDEITSAELGAWLDTLREGLRDEASAQEMLVLLGFCRSGSFIKELSGWRRVVIASAAANESSYKGPLDPNDPSGVRDGEFFITEFFKAAAVGKSVLTSFSEAVQKTRLFTSTGTGTPNGPYADDSRQHPLLDDNGDGAGENAPAGDPGGDASLSRGLSIGVSTVTGNAPGDVQVTQVSETRILGAAESNASLWARVDDDKRLRSLWLEVKPPGYEPNAGGSDQVAMELPGQIYSGYNPQAGRYEWNSVSGFTEPGTYQVFFFARDDRTGNQSSLKETIVYKVLEGNQVPGPFHLLSPANASEHRTVLMLAWSESPDPDGDPVTYTVEISEQPTFATVAHRAERLSRPYYFVGREAGLKDLTTYYWRVKAIDYYGAQSLSTETWSFKTNNTNPLAGWIAGRVYSSTTAQPIPSATVQIGGQQMSVLPSGDFLGLVQAGTYPVTAAATGFTSKTYSGVVIRDAEVATRDFGLVSTGQPIAGDLDGNGQIGLADAILALQILAGIEPAVAVAKEGDVNGDGRIGLQEALYILQKAAGLR